MNTNSVLLVFNLLGLCFSGAWWPPIALSAITACLAIWAFGCLNKKRLGKRSPNLACELEMLRYPPCKKGGNSAIFARYHTKGNYECEPPSRVPRYGGYPNWATKLRRSSLTKPLLRRANGNAKSMQNSERLSSGIYSRYLIC